METIKNENELIAEFMRLDKHPNNSRAYWVEDQGIYLTFDNLQFHKSWNQLMPVVEKIEKGGDYHGYGFKVTIERDWACISYRTRFSGLPKIPDIMFGDGSKLECTYKVVVDFIKWHNSQLATQKHTTNSAGNSESL